MTTSLPTKSKSLTRESAPSLQQVQALFRRAPRAELEQALLRVAIPFAAMSVMLVIWAWRGQLSSDQFHGLLIAIAFLVCSLCLAAHILAVGDNTNVKYRRIVGIVADNAVNSYFMLVMEEGGAVVLGVYLFVTFGNGFRYGRFYLHLSQAFGLLGFASVTVYSKFWSENWPVGIGVLVAMIVLPFYVGVLAQRITEAKKRADEANNAKSRFLANVSHEMRTPLNGVIAMSDLLRESPLNAAQREIVDTLATSAQLALAQVEDVLDAAKIEAGRVHLERRAFCLARLINDTVKVVLPQAHYKGLAINTEISVGSNEYFQGDPHHLRQILLNLLSNAIKFTEIGSIELMVTCASDTSPPRYRIEVRDTGIGIPPQKISSIFDAFAQADDSITRVYGGTGLGTTIARQLVLLMNGDIGVTSSEGRGTTFWFEIPLERTEAAANDPELDAMGNTEMLVARVQQITGGTLARKKGVRVLVAEDNPTNQRVTELILASRGHVATIVPNGEIALDALEQGQYDIALFDLSMPVLSGLDALKTYRFVAESPIPVLMLSANVTRELIAECKAAGASDFITKPVRASVLLEAIERHLLPQGRSSNNEWESRSSGQTPSAQIFDERIIEELKQLSTDEDFFVRLLDGFRVDCERLCSQIALELASANWVPVKDLAHALKGGAGGVGALALYNFAEKLEKATVDTLRAETATLQQELSKLASLTLTQIALLVRHQRKAPPDNFESGSSVSAVTPPRGGSALRRARR